MTPKNALFSLDFARRHYMQAKPILASHRWFRGELTSLSPHTLTLGPMWNIRWAGINGPQWHPFTISVNRGIGCLPLECLKRGKDTEGKNKWLSVWACFLYLCNSCLDTVGLGLVFVLSRLMDKCQSSSGTGHPCPPYWIFPRALLSLTTFILGDSLVYNKEVLGPCTQYFYQNSFN